MDYLPFILFAAVVVAALLIGVCFSAKRRKELAAWAQAHGLGFSAGREEDIEYRYPNFQCLHQGDNRYACNVMQGRWHERECAAFDYHYETHSTDGRGGQQTEVHEFSAVVLASPVPLKPLSIRHEGFFDKVAEFFGLDDIEFESAEFNRRFHVKSPDKKWAFDVIHQRTMEFMLSMPDFSLQFGADAVIAWRNRKLKPAEFGQAADLIAGILDRLPEYLVKQQMGQA